jgi:hypothetical protein
MCCLYTASLLAVRVTTQAMHVVGVLLVGGPSSCAYYQVDFLCLLEQGTVELIFIHNLAFIFLVLPSVTHIWLPDNYLLAEIDM